MNTTLPEVLREDDLQLAQRRADHDWYRESIQTVASILAEEVDVNDRTYVKVSDCQSSINAVKAKVEEIRAVQGQHSTMLKQHSQDLEVLKLDVTGIKKELAEFKGEVGAKLDVILSRLPSAN